MVVINYIPKQIMKIYTVLLLAILADGYQQLVNSESRQSNTTLINIGTINNWTSFASLTPDCNPCDVDSFFTYATNNENYTIAVKRYGFDSCLVTFSNFVLISRSKLPTNARLWLQGISYYAPGKLVGSRQGVSDRRPAFELGFWSTDIGGEPEIVLVLPGYLMDGKFGYYDGEFYYTTLVDIETMTVYLIGYYVDGAAWTFDKLIPSVYSVNGLRSINADSFLGWCTTSFENKKKTETKDNLLYNRDGFTLCKIDKHGKVVFYDHTEHYLWNSYAVVNNIYYSIVGYGSTSPYPATWIGTDVITMETKMVGKREMFFCAVDSIEL